MDSASAVAAYQAVRRASELAPSSNERDRAYIDALAQRYAAASDERAPLDSAYALAMAALVTRFPDDDDAATLYAESLMLLSPWNYWDGSEPRAGTPRLLASLETVIERNPNHPGACHFYIHATEAAHPERAVPCAERLAALMPAAGHIVHMPAHIYVRVGRYADAVQANVHATHADEEIVQDLAPDGTYRLGYYPHNYHFLWFAASMAGQSALAIDAARQTASKVDTALVRVPELSTLQHFLVTPLSALVRFGRWQEILNEPAPPADLAYPTAIWHYARALAFTALDSLDTAAAEVDAVRALAGEPSLQQMMIWELNPARTIVEIAAQAAAGELAARRGQQDAAIAHLRRAIALEDGLTYDEPPTWHLPVRQQLGDVLLAAGQPAQAEAVYREDLVRHPANGWSLKGLASSLRAQGRAAEADAAAAELARVWKGADVVIESARFAAR
jgi:hypothetical protein